MWRQKNKNPDSSKTYIVLVCATQRHVTKSKSEQKKKSFELRWRKSRQDEHVDSTLCQADRKRSQHKDLRSNLDIGFTSFTFSG